jgi:hypothetical protein
LCRTVYVEVLRWADHSSKESYRMCTKKITKPNRRLRPGKGCRATDEWMIYWKNFFFFLYRQFPPFIPDYDSEPLIGDEVRLPYFKWKHIFHFRPVPVQRRRGVYVLKPVLFYITWRLNSVVTGICHYTLL